MFPTTLLIEFVCLLFAIRYLKKDQSFWRSFIWFMFFITLIDGTGWAMATLYKQNNHWLYNIQLPVEVIYTGWIIHKIFASLINSKPWFFTGLAVFLLAYIIEGIYKSYSAYAAFSSSLASVLFFVSSGCYFYLLLKQEEHIDLLKHPPFWVMAGIFFFYFSSTAVNVFFEELMKINIVKGIPLRFYIFTLLNAILYGCWINAFRCRYQQTRSSF